MARDLTNTLAVFANDLGASFIDCHLSDLAPGRTVAVGTLGAVDAGNLWPVKCPALLLDKQAHSLKSRVLRRLGRSEAAIREAMVERFLRHHGVTVVLAEYLDDFLEFRPLIERLGIPYVIQGHGIDVSASLLRPGMAERYLGYRSARAILTRSELHRRRLIDLGLPEDKVHVNRGGVAVPAAPIARAPGAGKRLLGIGRMVPKKGPMYLMEAFRRAAERDPELSLDYVGGGPMLPAARQFVAIHGLQDRIHLHGLAPEDVKQQLLKDCGVFVQHSLTDPETGDEEGLPAAVQEAMGAGMAVVSTRHAGIVEAVVEGETGFLVNEGDVAGMADAFLKVGPLAAGFGEAGHRRALEKDDWRWERGRLQHWLFGAPVP